MICLSQADARQDLAPKTKLARGSILVRLRRGAREVNTLAEHRAGATPALIERFDTEPFSDFSQMSKLYRARSLLYRRQILQANTRWN